MHCGCHACVFDRAHRRPFASWHQRPKTALHRIVETRPFPWQAQPTPDMRRVRWRATSGRFGAPPRLSRTANPSLKARPPIPLRPNQCGVWLVLLVLVVAAEILRHLQHYPSCARLWRPVCSAHQHPNPRPPQTGL